MTTLNKQLITLFLVIVSLNIYGQKSGTSIFDKNSLDLQCLGNKGFFTIGYNRIIHEQKNLYFIIGPALGFVPGSHEDSLNSIPSFAHLNLGINLVYGHLKYRFHIGTSYSKIFTGDRYHARPKTNYNRILGELGFSRFFPLDEFGIKLAFTPILFDDGANDVSDIPVSFTFQITL